MGVLEVVGFEKQISSYRENNDKPTPIKDASRITIRQKIQSRMKQ